MAPEVKLRECAREREGERERGPVAPIGWSCVGEGLAAMGAGLHPAQSSAVQLGISVRSPLNER